MAPSPATATARRSRAGARAARRQRPRRGARRQAKLDELAVGLPDGVTIDVFYDRGVLVNKAVHTVVKALVEAVVLVLVLLVLFLGDLRAALTVALILPLSALATFILMRQFNLTANLMSLGGLAIAIGMLVDAAVVVVENIVTQLAHAGSKGRLPRLHLIYRATREVAVPVSSGILIIIIVFLPLLTLQGLEGKLFVPVALTIVFALASSLLLSLTIIPVLSSFLLGKVSHEEPWVVRQMLRGSTARCWLGPAQPVDRHRCWRWPCWSAPARSIPASARPSCRPWTRAT
jgi:cobalt-zinc-cadmium resistance protein CzcA